MTLYTSPGGINPQPRSSKESWANWQRLLKIFYGNSNLIINADGSISAPPVSPDPLTPILVDSQKKPYDRATSKKNGSTCHKSTDFQRKRLPLSLQLSALLVLGRRLSSKV